MRLLYWTPFFLPDIGGMETLAAKLLPRLRRLGHEIAVVTSHSVRGTAGEAALDGIPVHRFHFRPAFEKSTMTGFVQVLKEIAALKRSFQPDIVHLHTAPDPTGYFHLNTLQAHPAPTLVTIHSGMIGPDCGRDTLTGKLLLQAGWTTAVATAILEEVRALVPDIRDRSSVIHNGLDEPTVEPRPLPFDPPCILCLTRLVPYKGVDLAIRAFAAVVARVPAARLVIAGEGAERSALELLAAELGLQDTVDFLGRVQPDAVPDLLNKATMLLLPSRTEAFPMTALEAMQMGRPVVATAVGGVPEAVLDGRNGLVVPPEDCGALAAAILALLEHPDRAKSMGTAARERQERNYRLQDTAAAYDALYRRLVTRHA